jgi:hypothetical protein
MKQLYPKIKKANLWGDDDRLGKTLDALFSIEERDIAGLLVEYHYIEEYVVASGPVQIAYRDQDATLHLYEDMPDSDMIAAALGRAIQAIFSANHICDYIANGDSIPNDATSGYSLSALFTSTGLFLFHDDPWWVLDTYPEDTKTAASQLCTILLKPAPSAHLKLARAEALAQDIDIFYAIQKNGLDTLKAQNVAQFMRPDMSEVLGKL